MDDKYKFDKILRVTKEDLHIKIIYKLICLVKSNHPEIKLLTPLCDEKCGCCESRLACKKVEKLYDVSYLFAQFIESKKIKDPQEKENLKTYFYMIGDAKTEKEIDYCYSLIKDILSAKN